MRIDASNLLIAAQASINPARAAKPAAETAFEPLAFPKVAAQPQERAKDPVMPQRPQKLGSQLDIKV